MRINVFFAVAATLCLAQPPVRVQPVTLRVAMYPFVPESVDVFHTLETEFERAHDGVNVELVDEYKDDQGKSHSLAADYYKGGLERAVADIYEIDTVLLGDMASKLQNVTLEPGAFRPELGDAVTVNGQTLGVPHWVCGNFLFYRRGDAAVRDARDWSDFTPLTSHGGILTDFQGTSTLGEWYLTALASDDGQPGTIMARLKEPSLDPSALKTLTTMLGLCPSGFCRSQAFHDRVGFYGRLFARGRSRGYIGYSETLHYALQEIGESCAPTDGCLSADDIAVRALPLDSDHGRHVGWLDAFGLDRHLGGRNRELAGDFVTLATSWEMYRRVLTPSWPDAPRYLLPARTRPQGALPEAPLYPELEAAFGNRLFLSGPGLNSSLREKAVPLHCSLPADRDDADWRSVCSKQ